MRSRAIRVFLVCSGLGHVQRGYESFTIQCFEALSKAGALELFLFGGKGESTGNRVSLLALRRNSKLTKFIGKMVNRHPYYIEQVTFFMFLFPYLIRLRPDVIYFSDGTIGNLLWHWRRLSKQNYKLLFSNGGPLLPPFDRWDHIQQVAPCHFDFAVRSDVPSEKQTVLPYGFKMQSGFESIEKDGKDKIRRQLDLPTGRKIVLSVGVINSSHKRMDYLIREIAILSVERPFLLLLGERDSETEEIINIGKSMLSDENFEVRRVQSDMVNLYYSAADVFVLASVNEGLPRVLIEACSSGLPCLAHDYEISRYVLGSSANLADFTRPGALADLLNKILSIEENPSQAIIRHNDMYRRFSWDKLSTDYFEMIKKCYEQ